MRGFLKGLGPNVLALSAASFFTDFAAEMVVPLLPLFLTGPLKASAAVLGLIEGLADSLSSLLRIVSGGLSDRFRRRKPFILGGYGVSVIARPLYGLASSAGHVLAIRVTDRIGKGLRLAARDALIADSCAPEARGKAFGLQRAMDNLGAALGPLVASALLLTGYSMPQVFFLTAIPAAFVVVVIGAFVREVPPRLAAPDPPSFSLRPFDVNFRWFLATVTVFTLGNSSDLFIVLRAAECGVPERYIPAMWTGLALVRMGASVPAGMLSDRMDRRRVVLVGWIVYAAVYAGLAFARTPTAVLALVAAYGLHHALAESVLRAMVADLVPAERRGTAYGLFHFCVGVAYLPASVVFGWLMATQGAAAAFLTGAALATAACAMLLRVKPGVPRARPIARTP